MSHFSEENSYPDAWGEIEIAFTRRVSDIVVEAAGRVVRVLRDDLVGDRHQRWIVKLESGHTVLIAHNIDVAPRVENVKTGDSLRFKGEYEWGGQGGIVHWTHRDGRRRHASGFIEHGGRLYQ